MTEESGFWLFGLILSHILLLTDKKADIHTIKLAFFQNIDSVNGSDLFFFRQEIPSLSSLLDTLRLIVPDKYQTWSHRSKTFATQA